MLSIPYKFRFTIIVVCFSHKIYQIHHTDNNNNNIFPTAKDAEAYLFK